MKEGTTSLGARAQSAIVRAAVLYKPRLATFNFNFLGCMYKSLCPKNVDSFTDQLVNARITSFDSKNVCVFCHTMRLCLPKQTAIISQSRTDWLL
jgi:hypothetical protein